MPDVGGQGTGHNGSITAASSGASASDTSAGQTSTGVSDGEDSSSGTDSTRGTSSSTGDDSSTGPSSTGTQPQTFACGLGDPGVDCLVGEEYCLETCVEFCEKGGEFTYDCVALAECSDDATCECLEQEGTDCSCSVGIGLTITCYSPL